MPPSLPALFPERRRNGANISTGGGVLVYVTPVPRTVNGVQPSRPSSAASTPGMACIHPLGWAAPDRPAAPGSIRASAPGAGFHL